MKVHDIRSFFANHQCESDSPGPSSEELVKTVTPSPPSAEREAVEVPLRKKRGRKKKSGAQKRENVEEVSIVADEEDEVEVVMTIESGEEGEGGADGEEKENGVVIDDDEEEEVIQPRRRSSMRIQEKAAKRKARVLSDSEDDAFQETDAKKRNKKERKKAPVTPKTGRRKSIDAAKRAFLESGVPDVVVKAREKKEVEEKQNSPNGEVTKSSKKTRTEKSGLRRSSRKAKKITSYFRDESSDSSESDSDASSLAPSPKKEPKKIVDPMTRAFLDSGVPDVVVKAQKIVEKKKVEDDYLSLVGFFPRVQSSISLENNFNDCVQVECEQNLPYNGRLLQDDELDVTPYLISEEAVLTPFVNNSAGDEDSKTVDIRRKLCCLPICDYSVSDKDVGIESSKGIPWIEECCITNVEDLCCDKSAMAKFTEWLKTWKSDIRDDGGTSRKVEVKKRRKGSDSDFVTSDEEEGEMKKKSVLLSGPPGCGKTAAVYTIAKRYGFHVVEVNFSSRRQGKDVLQKVEEAVLSHRLTSSQNCLLLFEDIDLVDSKEDEGFHSSVAQLITTAVRPIVMTTSYAGLLSLDPKLERKDPLIINFNYPQSSQVVRKVLKPLVMKRCSTLSSGKSDSDISFVKSSLKEILDSVSRHARNDIRQAINQVQWLFAFDSRLNSFDMRTTHQHSLSMNSTLDLEFIRPSVQTETSLEDENDDNNLRLTLKARKRIQGKCMETSAEMLTFLCDLDLVDSIVSIARSNSSDPDFKEEIESLKLNYFEPSLCNAFARGHKAGTKEWVLQALVMNSDTEVLQREKGYILRDDLSEYCDNIYCEGGWEVSSCVRTIIKKNTLDSVGRLAKRNGRVTSYFNRLDRTFTSRVCDTFGFGDSLKETSS